MGERELLLDDLSVEEVMRLLGAARRAGGQAPSVERERIARPVVDEAAPRSKAREDAADHGSDWREALRASGAGRSEPKAAQPPPTTTEPEPPGQPERLGRLEMPPPPPASAEGQVIVPPATPGIVVGSADRDLFTGPFSHLETLAQIARTTEGCTRCPLYETATKAVPGEGNANAELVCVGEAPGATEDETGRPFVGQAGQLLTKILGAINLAREDVFICNVLKHRPPGNRNPFPKEVEACSPYLVRQLELIRPKAILALGTFAAQTLLNTKLSIGKLRGAVHKYHGIPLIVTYHPAALLRNPAWKRPTWEDVQHVRRILDSAPSAP